MMLSSPSGDTPAASNWKPLAPNPRRVLGVLIEKAKTTPAAYPMTINAIVAGSNQKNNREPLMTLDDNDVVLALNDLEALGAASEAPIVSRAVKYRHHAYAWLGVDRKEMAVMTELLLRGEQSVGDLRGRAARMEPIADLVELKPIVDGLIERGLMIALTAPGRGQIVSHNLYKEPELAALRARYAGHVASGSGAEASTRGSVLSHTMSPDAATTSRALGETLAGAGNGEKLEALSGEVAELKSEVAELREEFMRLNQRIREIESVKGGDPG